MNVRQNSIFSVRHDVWRLYLKNIYIYLPRVRRCCVHVSVGHPYSYNVVTVHNWLWVPALLWISDRDCYSVMRWTEAAGARNRGEFVPTNVFQRFLISLSLSISISIYLSHTHAPVNTDNTERNVKKRSDVVYTFFYIKKTRLFVKNTHHRAFVK